MRYVTQGFHSLEGWDPVTGLGSVDFAKLAAVVATFATSSPSVAPSMPPTKTPTFKRIPIQLPIDLPTKMLTPLPPTALARRSLTSTALNPSIIVFLEIAFKNLTLHSISYIVILVLAFMIFLTKLSQITKTSISRNPVAHI